MKIIKTLFIAIFAFILFLSCDFMPDQKSKNGFIRVSVDSTLTEINDVHKAFVFFYNHVPVTAGDLTFLDMKYTFSNANPVLFESDSDIPEVYISYFHDMNGNLILDSGEGYAVRSAPVEVKKGKTVEISILIE